MHRDQAVEPTARSRSSVSVPPPHDAVPTANRLFLNLQFLIQTFADVIGDTTSITRTFERLAVTYASMEEERLRDQILAMPGNIYGLGTGESFSKRGKADILLTLARWRSGLNSRAQVVVWSESVCR